MNDDRLPGAKRILIVRLSAIGDIVMASPLIAALRAGFPDARLYWLAQPEGKALLEYHGDLDEVIVWPRNEWRELWRERRWRDLAGEIGAFRARLRGYRFDLAIDLQGLLKSGFLGWLSGATERIGLGSREGSRLLMNRVIEKGGDADRIGSEYLHLAERLGLPTGDFSMRVGLGPEDERYAEAVIAEQDLAEGYAVICPFTTRPQKHWFETRWVELIPRLERAFGLRTVMLGGPGDRQAAQRMTDRVDADVIDQVGQTGLRQAAALIKHAALLIGVDTGLTHMGIAFDRPTLCLFGSTCPYLDTTRENAVVIYHKLACSPCRRTPTCNGRFDCMQAIEVDEVLQRAALLLKEERAAL
jgi:heptosyltransferase-1